MKERKIFRLILLFVLSLFRLLCGYVNVMLALRRYPPGMNERSNCELLRMNIQKVQNGTIEVKLQIKRQKE